MTAPRPGAPVSRGIGSWVLLAGVGGMFGFFADVPHAEGLAIALVGIAVAGALQRVPSPPSLATFALVPVLLALGTVAVVSPLGLLPELLAGASGLATLVWLADDRDRPAGGFGRARTAIAVPALALAIAWASALLLPSRSASLGVAVGLIVFSVAAVAYLIGQPEVFDREEAPS